MLKNNLAQNEDSLDISTIYLNDDKRIKLLKLQHKLKRLREELNINVLQELKQCRSNLETASQMTRQSITNLAEDRRTSGN